MFWQLFDHQSNPRLRRVLWNLRLSSALVFPAKDVRTGRPDTPSEGGGTWVFFIWRTYPDRICYRPGCDDRECRVFLLEGVRIGERAAIPPECITSGILLRRHSIRIFCIRRLTPDGRGGRFNFPGRTYPDPLIALTRRVSQPFLHSAAMFS